MGVDPLDHRVADGAVTVSLACAGGTAVRAFSTGRPAGVAAPVPRRRAAGWSSGRPVEPEPAPDLRRRCRASPATTRRATIRSTSSALPRTASTAGPGSAFHGSVASSSALVSRMSRQVASRAEVGLARRPTPRRPRRRPLGAHRREPAVGIGGGPDAAALRADHRRHPGQQVAEVVGQVGVVAGRDALVGEVAVAAEGDVAQQVVADGVDAEVVGEVGRRDLVDARTWTSSRPDTSSHPCTSTWAGGSMPAAMHMAGHHTQWNRMMSLPIRWCTAGHHASNRSGSSP